MKSFLKSMDHGLYDSSARASPLDVTIKALHCYTNSYNFYGHRLSNGIRVLINTPG